MRDEADRPDDIDALLRARPLPEPPAWFAARTVARLRGEEREGFTSGWLGGLLRRRVAAAVLAALVLAGAGWGLGARHSDQKLTFAALELAAQGESPFTEDETAWPDSSF